MNNLNYYAGIFIAGAVIGGLAVTSWLPSLSWLESGEGVRTLTATSSQPTLLALDTSGSVSVMAQAAGSTVFVATVTVPPPGVWVAVREVEGATIGNILGAARARGPMSNLEIPLLRDTDPSKTYAIQLYRDEGDDVFSKELDSVYVDFDTGNPVIAPFTTF